MGCPVKRSCWTSTWFVNQWTGSFVSLDASVCVHVCVCAICILSWISVFKMGNVLCVLSCVWLSGTLWTVAHQASLFMGFSQARILEQVAIFYSRGSFRPKDWTLVSCISCIGRWILYHCTTWEAHGQCLTLPEESPPRCTLGKWSDYGSEPMCGGRMVLNWNRVWQQYC